MSERVRRAEARGEGAPAEGKAAEATATAAPTGIYLRTVYPLNPGIPHFLDFPRREG